jgi:hypothetical protein
MIYFDNTLLYDYFTFYGYCTTVQYSVQYPGTVALLYPYCILYGIMYQFYSNVVYPGTVRDYCTVTGYYTSSATVG